MHLTRSVLTLDYTNSLNNMVITVLHCYHPEQIFVVILFFANIYFENLFKKRDNKLNHLS